MRAITYDSYGKIEKLALADVPSPSPHRGRVLVDIHRAALNPKDSFIRKGRFAVVSGRHFPKRSGLDFSGVVRATDLAQFPVGARVFGALSEWRFRRGTLAESVCVTPEELAIIPDGVSFDAAAAMALVGLTALQALRDIAQLKPGTRVWIHGASGGVGTAAIQLARVLGAHVSTTSSPANFSLCEELGAQRTLDYTASPVSVLRGAIDVVFDVFGNLRLRDVASVFTESQKGVFVSTVPSAQRLAKEAISRLAPTRERLVVVRSNHVDLTQIGTWLADGSIKAVIDSTYPLEKTQEAFRVLESKRTKGKLLVRIREGA